mmetsp:Transcript_2264/g.8873  ORF Transcript_2264/g.8873 Transcript_2264/m.8873 type:complete len:215 (+) Transcript_2264:392-1036(+)
MLQATAGDHRKREERQGRRNHVGSNCRNPAPRRRRPATQRQEIWEHQGKTSQAQQCHRCPPATFGQPHGPEQRSVAFVGRCSVIEPRASRNVSKARLPPPRRQPQRPGLRDQGLERRELVEGLRRNLRPGPHRIQQKLGVQLGPPEAEGDLDLVRRPRRPCRQLRPTAALGQRRCLQARGRGHQAKSEPHGQVSTSPRSLRHRSCATALACARS